MEPPFTDQQDSWYSLTCPGVGSYLGGVGPTPTSPRFQPLKMHPSRVANPSGGGQKDHMSCKEAQMIINWRQFFEGTFSWWFSRETKRKGSPPKQGHARKEAGPSPSVDLTDAEVPGRHRLARSRRPKGTPGPPASRRPGMGVPQNRPPTKWPGSSRPPLPGRNPLF